MREPRQKGRERGKIIVKGEQKGKQMKLKAKEVQEREREGKR